MSDNHPATDEHIAHNPLIDWDKNVGPLRTTPTLQVVVNPLLRRGSPIHERAFEELRKLEADYVRYVPWFPYPHDAIAELYPPKTEKRVGTSAASTPSRLISWKRPRDTR